jgi:hypothetical protein
LLGLLLMGLAVGLSVGLLVLEHLGQEFSQVDLGLFLVSKLVHAVF